jgi:hypothetical protein
VAEILFMMELNSSSVILEFSMLVRPALAKTSLGKKLALALSETKSIALKAKSGA